MRAELEALPPRMRALPLDARGYPVPWFVSWVDGVPEFRLADRAKFVRALRERRCWCCGETLGRFLTFVIGPMCAVNRVTSEPPSHLECAEWAARNCPWLSRPHATRREDERTAAGEVIGGQLLRRNPGVALVWTTRTFHLMRDGQGGALLLLGDPTSTSWWREGRAATRAEALASIESGLPSLIALAVEQGDLDEVAALQAAVIDAYQYLPADVPAPDPVLTIEDVADRLAAAAATAGWASVDAAAHASRANVGMACRVCGCTEDAACPGGCLWAAPGLCSQCAARGAA
jgi:hypothetical protein